MNLSPYGRNVMLFELSIVLRSLSVLRTFGFASLCQHNSPIRYASWAKHSLRLKLLVIGYRVLAIGLECATVPWFISLPCGQKSYKSFSTLMPALFLCSPKSIAFRYRSLRSPAILINASVRISQTNQSRMLLYLHKIQWAFIAERWLVIA